MQDPSPRFRRRAYRLQAWVTIIILALGFWQAVTALSAPAIRQQLAANWTVEAVRDGRFTGIVNDAVANTLPWARQLGAVWR